MSKSKPEKPLELAKLLTSSLIAKIERVKENTQTCWFSSSDASVFLSGGVFLQSDGDGRKAIEQVTVRGATSTPFVLSAGDYRYEFNVAKGSAFNLKLYIHGVAVPCKPSKFDTNTDGTVDLVTLFSVP